jgi:hypothetical protein
MKMAESRKIILGSCIIDFDEVMVLSWSLNICKVIMLFLIFKPNIEEECHDLADVETQA